MVRIALCDKHATCGIRQYSNYCYCYYHLLLVGKCTCMYQNEKILTKIKFTTQNEIKYRQCVLSFGESLWWVLAKIVAPNIGVTELQECDNLPTCRVREGRSQVKSSALLCLCFCFISCTRTLLPFELHELPFAFRSPLSPSSFLLVFSTLPAALSPNSVLPLG